MVHLDVSIFSRTMFLNFSLLKSVPFFSFFLKLDVDYSILRFLGKRQKIMNFMKGKISGPTVWNTSFRNLLGMVSNWKVGQLSGAW